MMSCLKVSDFPSDTYLEDSSHNSIYRDNLGSTIWPKINFLNTFFLMGMEEEVSFVILLT